MKRRTGLWLSISWLVGLMAIAWVFPFVHPPDPFNPVGAPLLSPGSYPPLGTDGLGRDFLSRIALGTRMTMTASVLAASITITSGIIIGLITSMAGRLMDQIVLGFINAALAIPGLLFAFLLTASIGPGLRTVILAIGFGLAPGYARLARSVFIQIRTAEFITAARALGVKNTRIALFHLLPNAIRGVTSISALHFSWAIMGITTLSFLGLSGDPSIPELGNLLNTGRQFLVNAPHLALFPGSIISLTVLSIYRISEELK